MNELKQDITPVELTGQGTKMALGLSIVDKLLSRLHKEGIAYCHWKSNEHVLEGMLGATDLDVLVETGAFLKLTCVLSETGFKRFTATPSSAYPAIEDYLAMDAETGKLVHLHLHYQLIVGEPHLKGYRLPWEHRVLSTRLFDAQKNIYVADPNMELVLLMVRAALKLRARDRLSVWLGLPYLRDRMPTEFHWLRERIHPESVINISKEFLGEETELSENMIAGQPSFHELAAFGKCIMPILRLYRTYGPVGARWRRWLREAYWLGSVLNKRYFHLPMPLRRTNPNGGRVIAFVGCDGSGKSTHMKAIVKWLSWKLDVVPIYFGSGDGPSSFLRWPLKLASDWFHILREWGSNHASTPAANQPIGLNAKRRGSWLRSMAIVPWALTLALEKRNNLRKATRARNRGMTVICDRYPQNQVMGFNDGPLLNHWLNHRLGLLRSIGRWESTPYRWAETYLPDLVLKLRVTPEVAVQRTQAMSIEEHRRRVNAIKSFRYPPPTKIVEIDADEPLDRVLLKVKHFVWQEL